MQDYRVTRPKYRVPQEQGLAPFYRLSQVQGATEVTGFAPFYRLSQVQGATEAMIRTILQAVSGTGCHRIQDLHHKRLSQVR